MNKKTTIQEALDKIGSEVLSEEVKTELKNAFEKTVEERVELRVKNALNEQDESYAQQIQETIDAVNRDHIRKLETVVEAIDNKRTKQLVAVAKKYEREMQAEAANLKNYLTEHLNSYLDLYIEKLIPQKSIQEAVNNKKAMHVLKEMRSTLGVDLAVANESIRAGVIDGRQQILEAKKANDKLINENARLKDRLISANRETLLAEKTKGLPSSKKQYVYNMLGDKDINFIKENFDYTVEIFERNQVDTEAALKRQAAKSKKVDRVTNQQRGINRPRQTLHESVDRQAGTQFNEMDMYLAELEDKF